MSEFSQKWLCKKATTYYLIDLLSIEELFAAERWESFWFEDEVTGQLPILQ